MRSLCKTVFFAALLSLYGCGQKGPLVIPQEPSAFNQKPLAVDQEPLAVNQAPSAFTQERPAFNSATPNTVTRPTHSATIRASY